MAQWTDEQKDAINASGRSIIVSAAAGSGKTSVLIERLIRIISNTDNPVEIEKMVVVTFTKAAAAEMKQRLSASLLKKIEENPYDAWLARQHANLGLASISTIHSFCFDLIRENIAQLPLTSEFRIMDENEQTLFFNTVLKDIMDGLYENKAEDMKFLCDCFCGNDDANLVELITRLYSGITSIPFYKNRLKKFSEYYDENIYKQIFLDDIKSKISQYQQEMSEVSSMAEKMAEQKVIDRVRDDIYLVTKYKEILEEKGFLEMIEFISNNEFGRYPVKPRNAIVPEEREIIKNRRGDIKKSFKNFVSYKEVFENIDKDIENHKKIFNIISEIIAKFDDRLFEYKVEKNAIGFDDAEQITLKLLGDCDDDGNIIKTPFGEEISKEYKIIMVDEFQDSNDRQDMIFRLLSNGGTPEKYGDNLFFVGDVKQAIYRFRQANPDNFMGAMKKFVPYNENDSENAYIKLNKNFRSSVPVIDFVNYVFKNIMSETMGEIQYDESEYLINGSKFFDYERDTHIMMIDPENSEENTEALCIASKIRQMIDEKILVSDGNGGSRPCRMKDFCILTRNKKFNAIYIDALEEYGLIANCEGVSGYLKSREISVLINILRVIDNPMNDIPLTSVLMSPMFMITADEIAAIRLINKKAKLYMNIVNGLGKNKKADMEAEADKGEENEISNESVVFAEDSVTYQKLDRFYNLISDFRLISSFHTLPELIQIIYDRTDFTSVISIGKDSEKKRANLKMLLEYANSFETSGNGGIGGFLRYVDKISEYDGDFASVNSNSTVQDAVTVYNMHKSKGLEFTFVFIAQTDNGFNHEDEKKFYQFSTELGLGFKIQNKKEYKRLTTLPFNIISNRNKIKMLSEEMRLLYVALTRAKERLFITVNLRTETGAGRKASPIKMAENIKRNQGITPDLVQNARCMADWLYMCLISQAQAAPLREELGINECFRYKDDFKLSFEKFSADTLYKYENNPECSVSDEIDNEATERLRENFNFVYRDGESSISGTDVVSKLSVSDMSKNDDSKLSRFKRPDFAREKGMLTPAEKGTALHGFLQFADFEKLAENFEAEVERVVSRGHITAKQATAVKKEDIDAFLSSNVYKQICNAVNVERERKFLISIDDLELDESMGFDVDYAGIYKGTDGMLNGIMDMVIETKDGIILVDYKTDKVKSPEILLERYRSQLLLYKKALEKIQSKPVISAVIYSFYQKNEVKVF